MNGSGNQYKSEKRIINIADGTLDSNMILLIDVLLFGGETHLFLPPYGIVQYLPDKVIHCRLYMFRTGLVVVQLITLPIILGNKSVEMLVMTLLN